MNKNKPEKTIVIGAGLAGSEAAWALANAGIKVSLYEMRPVRNTPAHSTSNCAELVCSNSFRSNEAQHAIGCLKEEMRALNSLIMQAAEVHKVPSGKGLAIDRIPFSEYVTDKLETHPNITLIREEVKKLEEVGRHWRSEENSATPVVIAAGPLMADAFAQEFQSTTKTDDLYFYDSMAPLISADSIDYEQVFYESRYGAGDGKDYINCPMNKEQYYEFVQKLNQSEKVPPREFEDPIYFEGCLPVEVMAERGVETLRHGPMKPFGLRDPRTNRSPYAVVQLRMDNKEKTIYNMVGFQTRMTWGEQSKIIRTIPGLQNAEFLRMGAMHRNTYMNSPRLLTEQLELREFPGIYCAGQIVGVEGYVESAAMGMYVGHLISGRIGTQPPSTSAMGSLIEHVTRGNPEAFEPMNANWGLTPALPAGVHSRERKTAYLSRAKGDFEAWLRTQHSPDNSVAMNNRCG